MQMTGVHWKSLNFVGDQHQHVFIFPKINALMTSTVQTVSQVLGSSPDLLFCSVKTIVSLISNNNESAEATAWAQPAEGMLPGKTLYLYKMCFYSVLEKIQVSLEFPKDPTKIPKIPQD